MSDSTTDPEKKTVSTPNDRDDAPNSDSDDDDSTEVSTQFDRFTTTYLRGVIDRVGLAVLLLLALIAGWSFYSQTGTAIRTWLDPAYQPIALAVFNLTVLLVALAGVAHQLSRIRRSETDENTENIEDTASSPAGE